MSESTIAKPGADLPGEIVTSHTEILARLDRLQAAVDAIREDLKRIEQRVFPYGR